MAIHKSTIVWDDEKHPIVNLAMTNNDESDAAFLRTCVEFYQLSQAGANVQQLVLERLARIENILKSGVAITINGDGNSPIVDDQTDNIFDEVLEQIE